MVMQSSLLTCFFIARIGGPLHPRSYAIMLCYAGEPEIGVELIFFKHKSKQLHSNICVYFNNNEHGT